MRATAFPKFGPTIPNLGPEMPAMTGMPRVALPRRPTALPTGPRMYRLTRSSTVSYGGPGPAPPGFKVASTSASEWIFYWAAMKVLDPRRDPRQPPFQGGELWLYQSSELGAFTRQLGSAVVDFLFKTQFPYLAVRIQTFRFHLSASTFKQAYDQKQLEALMGKFNVIDIFEGDYIGDATGQAAIKLVLETLKLQQRQNPISAGKVYMVRLGF